MEKEHNYRLEQTRIISNNDFSVLMTDIIGRGKKFRFQTSGSSMSPFIMNDDVVTFCSINSKPIRVGDIVAFLHPINNNLIVHRIIAKNSGNFLIKADNAHKPDGWVEQIQIIGLVVEVERDGIIMKFGLGQEKWLISLLSRINVLDLSTRILRKCFPYLYKRLF
jgi:signal peptidase I